MNFMLSTCPKFRFVYNVLNQTDAYSMCLCILFHCNHSNYYFTLH